MRASMPLMALLSLPISVLGSCGLTLLVRSPALMASAWPAIASMGRSPRRVTQVTPPPASSPAATEPRMRISSSWPTVLSTWSRVVVA
jgi:hypothetical protein